MMEPTTGFIRAVVGDVAFIFGKGMVNGFFLARRKDRSGEPQLNVLVRSHGQYIPLSVPTGTVPAVDRLLGLDEVRPAPLLTVEFTPGDTGAEAHLTAHNPVLVTITDVSHEYDALVLTTSLGGAAYAQLPPGYYHVSAVVIDEFDDLLLAYGTQHNLHVDKGDDLIVSLPIRTAGVTEIAAALEAGSQPVLVGPEGDVVPLLDLVRIGRAPDSDLILESPEVSRHHAELLRIDADSYEVRDLGSTNGTHVNGVQVETAMVRDGDEIRLGTLALRLYIA
ncbi:FHA domain-containing protein [Kribbella sp. NPDC055071]